MIDPQKEAEIRRLYFAEHFKVGTICSQMSVHRDVVLRAISAERMVRTRSVAENLLLDPFKDFIARTLAQYPELRATRLFEMLKSRGYQGGVHTVRRHASQNRPRPKREVFFRLETVAGEQGQVDWAHFGNVQIGNTTRTLSCFVLVLSYSRGIFARFFLDQSTDNFLRGHVEAFAQLGGVPRVLLYDNLKSVVIERIGEHIRYHPRILDLAGHYHFAPRPCAPYRGNEKGKVERSIHYLRYSFFAGRSFRSVAQINAELAEWIAKTAHARTIAGTDAPVVDRLAIERPRLLPLPEQPFCADTTLAVSTNKTPYLRFDLNDYSIPHTHVGLSLTLSASEHRVRILDGSSQIANHARSYERGRRIEDHAHFAALEAQKRHARELRGRHRLVELCPSAAKLIELQALRNHALGSYTSQLLRLLDHYKPQAIERAITTAIARGALGVPSIEHILEQERRKKNQPIAQLPLVLRDARAEQLQTIAQPLDAYDSLSLRGEKS